MQEGQADHGDARDAGAGGIGLGATDLRADDHHATKRDEGTPEVDHGLEGGEPPPDGHHAEHAGAESPEQRQPRQPAHGVGIYGLDWGQSSDSKA